MARGSEEFYTNMIPQPDVPKSASVSDILAQGTRNKIQLLQHLGDVMAENERRKWEGLASIPTKAIEGYQSGSKFAQERQRSEEESALNKQTMEKQAGELRLAQAEEAYNRGEPVAPGLKKMFDDKAHARELQNQSAEQSIAASKAAVASSGLSGQLTTQQIAENKYNMSKSRAGDLATNMLMGKVDEKGNITDPDVKDKFKKMLGRPEYAGLNDADKDAVLGSAAKGIYMNALDAKMKIASTAQVTPQHQDMISKYQKLDAQTNQLDKARTALAGYKDSTSYTDADIESQNSFKAAIGSIPGNADLVAKLDGFHWALKSTTMQEVLKTAFNRTKDNYKQDVQAIDNYKIPTVSDSPLISGSVDKLQKVGAAIGDTSAQNPSEFFNTIHNQPLKGLPGDESAKEKQASYLTGGKRSASDVGISSASPQPIVPAYLPPTAAKPYQAPQGQGPVMPQNQAPAQQNQPVYGTWKEDDEDKVK